MVRTTPLFEPFAESDLLCGAELHERFARDGYLFVRGALKVEPLLRARKELTDVLVAAGLAIESEDGPIWTGADPSGFDRLLMYGPQAELHYLDQAEAAEIIECLWGAKPLIWRRVGIFLSFPNEDVSDIFPHRDRIVFTDDAKHYATLWVPLTRIGLQDGGLGIAKGSHRSSVRTVENAARPAQHVNRPTLKYEDITEPWCSSPFSPGDALFFHGRAIHTVTSNAGPRIRIAFALRCQHADHSPTPMYDLSLPEFSRRMSAFHALAEVASRRARERS
jgi:hypothetical protein